MLTLRPVDIDDAQALERHVEFERAHGRARFDAADIPGWAATTDSFVLLDAEDEHGEIAGCVTASTVATLGLDTVNLNAFCRPGEHHVMRALMDAVLAWPGAADARTLLAFVSDPTPPQHDAWLAAGFTLLSTRARVHLELQPDMPLPTAPLPADTRIIPLADVPHLASDALRVWNESHEDIPTVLPFRHVDDAAWRAELGVGEDDPFPPSLLVAVAPGDEIAGIAFINSTEGDRVYGHVFTCTSRAWRGRGVARALKTATVSWAVDHGVAALVATNDGDNAPMRAINDSLGYREIYRIGMYRRELGASL